MEDSPLGIDKWLVAMWLISSAKNGISSYELARAIGVTQKSAWFMLHRIRLAMQDGTGGKLGGHVEVDETYIGGKARNMHSEPQGSASSRALAAWARWPSWACSSRTARTATAPSRVGRPEHPQGRAASQRRDNVRRWLQRLHRRTARPTTAWTPITSTASSTTPRGTWTGRFTPTAARTSGSLLKRALKGTYVSVEPFHLFRYLDEQAFRFNTRKLSDAARFAITAASVFGKRLTFNRTDRRRMPQRADRSAPYKRRGAQYRKLP